MRIRVRNATAVFLVGAGLLASGCGSDGGASSSGMTVAVPGAVPDTSGAPSALAFDIVPTWEGDDAADVVLLDLMRPTQFDNRVSVVKNGRYLRFILTAVGGREVDLSVSIDRWNPGETHLVAVSWRDGCARLYIDGALAGSGTYAGVLHLSPGTPIAAYAPAGGAPIDTVTVYGATLPPTLQTDAPCEQA